MIFLEVAYIIFCVILAHVNFVMIGKDKKPNHWLNGLIHLTMAAVCYFVFWKPGAIIILCNARVFFDATLNYLRFGRINYVSLSPSSLIDKIERKIFGNDGYAPKIIYLLISISLNVIYYLKIKN